jgi:hypothetical protein
MQGWQPDAAPGYGWPLGERTWINPSPNAPNLSMARCYAGTVMLEGTTLSEGRGTTRPLELFGAPDIDAAQVIAEMRNFAPHWLARLQTARMLVRTDLPQARRQALRRRPDSRRRYQRYDHAAFRPGACRRWPSRRSAASTRTTRYGATLPTNTNTTAWPLI